MYVYPLLLLARIILKMNIILECLFSRLIVFIVPIDTVQLFRVANVHNIIMLNLNLSDASWSIGVAFPYAIQHLVSPSTVIIKNIVGMYSKWRHWQLSLPKNICMSKQNTFTNCCLSQDDGLCWYANKHSHTFEYTIQRAVTQPQRISVVVRGTDPQRRRPRSRIVHTSHV